MKRELICFYWLVLFFSGAILAGSGPIPQEPEKWNIISIVTDDQARWSIGAYGNRESSTPHMDRLAREGVRFLNAFVPHPVCSPSRVSFLTGLYSTRFGITDWISPEESEQGLGLPPESVTWPEILKEHGYATALIGKWHLGTLPQHHPTRHGFDHFFGFLEGGNRPMNPTLEVEGETRQLEGSLPDLLVDDAIRFIDTHSQRPFALLLHFRAPHSPYLPVPEEDEAPFRSLQPSVPIEEGIDLKTIQTWTREYYSSVHSIDRNLGRLLDALDRQNLSEKTIVLFTSDHGYMIGHHSLRFKGNAHWVAGGVVGPKRPNMYEESIAVPLMIRWPGVVRPGTEVSEMVTNTDILPSVLSMLGIEAPEESDLDGRDFTPLIRGKKISWREAIYGQYDLHNNGLAFMRMIRTTRWKLIRHHYSRMMDELYDLENDPQERRNLYRNGDFQEIRNRLQEELSAWQRSVDDPLLKGLPPID